MKFIFTQNKQTQFSYIFDQNSLLPNQSQSADQQAQEKVNFCQKNIELDSSFNPIEYFKNFASLLGELKDIPIILNCESTRFNSLFIREFGVETIQGFINKSSINEKKKNWGKYDVIILLWVIEKYSILHNKQFQNFDSDDWEYVSRIIPGKNPSQCMFKWLNILSHLTKSDKETWTQQEDTLLMRFVSQNQFHNKIRWHEVSKMLYESSPTKIYRTGKQCRQRWTCFLNPVIKKGHWSVEQDILLLQNFLDIGKKWSEIARKMRGRTENAVKNRFKLILSKKYKQRFKHGYISDKDFVLHHISNLKFTQKNQTFYIKKNKMVPKVKNAIKQYIQLINFNNQTDPNQSTNLMISTSNISQNTQRCDSNQSNNTHSQKTQQHFPYENFQINYEEESPSIFKDDIIELKEKQKLINYNFFDSYFS